MVVTDVTAEVAFLRAAFGARGDVRPGGPAEMRIGDSMIMVSGTGERDPFPAFLYVYVDDADATYERALSAGASSLEAPSDTPYGDRRAMVADSFGNVFQVAHRLAAARRAGHSVSEFDAMYASTPPWDIGRPQPALLRLAESGAITGRVLDIGCGTGEHALMAATLGLDATGIDSSRRAIALAEAKARDRGLAARFEVGDALELRALGEQFDTVIDSGLFHVFSDDDRGRYVASLAAAVKPGGRYFLLCFSDQQPGESGPRRVTQDEIRTAFASGWRVDRIDATTIDVTWSPTGAQAWLASLARTTDVPDLR
jgi:SAM-dependent methyltransferase